MGRIGILGGTFDPCHKGHINLALDALEQGKLDEVILMPAKVQPFKRDKNVTSSFHRLRMLEIAAKKYSGLRVSTFEMNQDEVSYTYLTLRKVRAMKGENTKIFFITGTDAFLGMPSWANSDELLSENRFIVGVRPGYRESELENAIEKVRNRYGTEIIKIDNRKFHISSTDVRKKVSEGHSVADFIDKDVEKYIVENRLYV